MPLRLLTGCNDSAAMLSLTSGNPSGTERHHLRPLHRPVGTLVWPPCGKKLQESHAHGPQQRSRMKRVVSLIGTQSSDFSITRADLKSRRFNPAATLAVLTVLSDQEEAAVGEKLIHSSSGSECLHAHESEQKRSSVGFSTDCELKAHSAEGPAVCPRTAPLTRVDAASRCPRLISLAAVATAHTARIAVRPSGGIGLPLGAKLTETELARARPPAANLVSPTADTAEAARGEGDP
ncbi:hypothetical protein AAFF_G00167580 [Aldrovandia affinis]|uniref:Uncharacterized protein n=1 Tax=Aldrovandia affinis TaxID=143900 RepID=A0AAD7RM30_9TELE|nr:hypothetical protein AAFF_G00167580 [Aldrovandia affinis]